MQHHSAGLQIIQGTQTGTSSGISEPGARGEPGAIRLFRRSPEVIYAVLMRHVAGSPVTSRAVGAAGLAAPTALRDATRAMRARVSEATVDGVPPDATAGTWVVVSSSAPSVVVLGVSGCAMPDLSARCVIEDRGAGSANLALFPEVTGGSIFSRGARRRKAEELCHELMSRCALAIVRHAGSTQPRSAPRQFTRASALLLAGGATFRGELRDISAGGISATIPRRALNADTPGAPSGAELLQHGDTALCGTLITRLKGANVTLPVRIVHLWPVAHGMRVGMQLT